MRVSSPPVGTFSSVPDVTDNPNPNSNPQCPQFKAFARYAALKSGVSLRRQPFRPVRLSTSPASSR
jgi:hypothetical protein